MDGFARNFAQGVDVITCFKFCVDRLRGFGSAWGRILPFSLYLAGRHQHRAALPRVCDDSNANYCLLKNSKIHYILMTLLLINLGTKMN